MNKIVDMTTMASKERIVVFHRSFELNHSFEQVPQKSFCYNHSRRQSLQNLEIKPRVYNVYKLLLKLRDYIDPEFGPNTKLSLKTSTSNGK